MLSEQLGGEEERRVRDAQEVETCAYRVPTGEVLLPIRLLTAVHDGSSKDHSSEVLLLHALYLIISDYQPH